MIRHKLAATLTLAIAFFASPARATHIPSMTPASQIVHSGAHPSSVKWPNATHHFTLQVGNSVFSQLEIDLPEGINVSHGIEITDGSNRLVDATVSIIDRKARIIFAQPVPHSTTLSILLEGIKTSDYLGRTWSYPFSGRIVGTAADIPLGIARIQTFK